MVSVYTIGFLVASMMTMLAIYLTDVVGLVGIISACDSGTDVYPE
jgi:hypothetical protein